MSDRVIYFNANNLSIDKKGIIISNVHIYLQG